MTTTASPLARVEEAHRLLAKARTVDEVKGVRDQAAAAALYAKERGYSDDIIRYAEEIKVRAEHKAGALLAEMPKHPAGRPSINRSSATTDLPPRLADLGIARDQSSQWQQVAAVPEPVFEDAIREAKLDGKGSTTASQRW